jgi:hypothetical protein
MPFLIQNLKLFRMASFEQLLMPNILIFDEQFQLLDGKVEKYYISYRNFEIMCAPFERALYFRS